MKKLDEWFRANKLSLNINKTKYIYFKLGRGNALKIVNDGLKINNTVLGKVASIKFLGVLIDD